MLLGTYINGNESRLEGDHERLRHASEDNSQQPVFLFFVRDSIHDLYNHQLRRLDNVIHMLDSAVGDGLTSGKSTYVTAGGVVPHANNSAWDDYQHYVDESSLGDSFYGNNGSAGFDDDDVFDNFSSPYLMPWPQRTAWIAVFTLMLLVATVGNTLVAWIVLGQ